MIFSNKNIHFYSPIYFFYRNQIAQLSELMQNDFTNKINENRYQIFYPDSIDKETFIIYEYLTWDSNYFKNNTIKIHYLNSKNYSQNFTQVITLFIEHLNKSYTNLYIFIELPSDEISFVQDLNKAGFALVESRIVHYKEILRPEEIERKCISANVDNIESIKKTAFKMRNIFDRTHADKYFSEEIADKYVEKYAENCLLEKLSDIVLIPENKYEQNAFLALKKNQLQNYSQIILTAVSSETNKGWYIDLVKNAVNYSLENNINRIINTTQINNAPVIHTLEKLGFKTGKTSHILSLSI